MVGTVVSSGDKGSTEYSVPYHRSTSVVLPLKVGDTMWTRGSEPARLASMPLTTPTSQSG